MQTISKSTRGAFPLISGYNAYRVHEAKVPLPYDTFQETGRQYQLFRAIMVRETDLGYRHRHTSESKLNLMLACLDLQVAVRGTI